MKYKIVKNSTGDVVAFGPNDENYDPTLKNGETLTVESDEIAEDMIKTYQAKLIFEADQIANDKIAILDRLGITADEAALLVK